MKITHYIMPRCSGKTIEAIELFKNSENCLFLINNYSKSLFKKEYGLTFDKNRQVIFSDKYPQRGRHVDKIIVDNFICSDKELFEYEYFFGFILPCLNKGGELILYSTSDSLYTKEQLVLSSLINYPQFLKVNNKDIEIESIKNTIKEINIKMLNPAKVNIVRKGASFINEEQKIKYKEGLGELRYQLSIEGKYIKD